MTCFKQYINSHMFNFLQEPTTREHNVIIKKNIINIEDVNDDELILSKGGGGGGGILQNYEGYSGMNV
jgi:hypothetical protein